MDMANFSVVIMENRKVVNMFFALLNSKENFSDP